MAVSKEQIQQIIGEGLTELAQQGVLDLGEISSIVNAISNPLIETFEAQAGLSGLPDWGTKPLDAASCAVIAFLSNLATRSQFGRIAQAPMQR